MCHILLLLLLMLAPWPAAAAPHPPDLQQELEAFVADKPADS